MIKMELLYDVVDEAGRAEYEAKGEQCISVEQVRSFLNANKFQDIQFDISSLGGNLAAAITISQLIKAFPNKTIGNIIGLTASAGTIIANSCDETIMSDGTLFLIHNGWKEVTGNVYDMQKAAQDLAKSDALMIKLYGEKTGLPETKIIDLMKASDWLTSSEALQYKFVDRVYKSGSKIAASVQIINAKEKISKLLLIKLEEKMKIPWKSTKAQAEVMNVLALKDGKQLLINAAEPAEGVEVAPLGAGATLEDGTFELTDGRVITVSGGTISNVETPSEPAGMDASAVVDAVAAMLVNSEAKITSMIEAKLKPLEVLASSHKPVKGAGPSNPGAASVNSDLQAKIEAKQAEIKASIEEKRKGGK